MLEGKFRVERILGEGAMGLVVEATHLVLDERVALKFLRREAREDKDIVARFAREARAAAKIKSDHVARVYDVGNAPDGSPFIVMEYLQGSDLERLLETQGKVAPLDAVEHIIEACEGLAAAHAHGIIHRDIKPGNLFVSEQSGRRQIKLLDFGISKAGISGTFEDIDVGLAQTTRIMGSPHYMSPEQMRSTKDVDARADVWSLGVVLFELLTRETPFTASDVTGIIAQVLYEPHRKLRSLAPDIPEGLEQVVDRCLEKDAEKRFSSAGELAVALMPFAPKRARALVERASAVSTRGAGNSQPVDSYPPPGPGSTTGSSMTAPALSQREPSTSRGPVVWIAIALAVLAIAGVVLVTRGGSKPITPAAEPKTTAQAPTQTPSAEPPKVDPREATPAVATSAATPSTTPKPASSPAQAVPASPKPPRVVPRGPATSRPHTDPSENEIRLER